MRFANHMEKRIKRSNVCRLWIDYQQSPGS